MTKTRLFVPNSCYHIYARGNQKQTIFITKDDCKFYLKQLKLYKRKFGFKLYGYCLMPNHIHLVGEPAEQKELCIPKLMQSLHRSYTAYYNKKYKKVGHLWQGRFKSKLIFRDKYLIDCIIYVELNPVRADLINSPADYVFSSYKERSLGSAKKLLDNLLL